MYAGSRQSRFFEHTDATSIKWFSARSHCASACGLCAGECVGLWRDRSHLRRHRIAPSAQIFIRPATRWDSLIHSPGPVSWMR